MRTSSIQEEYEIKEVSALDFTVFLLFISTHHSDCHLESWQEIGVGTYSVCKRCVHKSTGHTYAVKVEIFWDGCPYLSIERLSTGDATSRKNRLNDWITKRFWFHFAKYFLFCLEIPTESCSSCQLGDTMPVLSVLDRSWNFAFHSTLKLLPFTTYFTLWFRIHLMHYEKRN